MTFRVASPIALALAIVVLSTTQAAAVCSADALQAVRAEMRAARAPRCGAKTLRRAFERARHRAATAAARATRECLHGTAPDVGAAQRALASVLAKSERSGATGKMPQDCADAYTALLQKLNDDLAAAVGAESTTTTTLGSGTTVPIPGATTTTLQPCTTIQLEVDKGDCSSVTSRPAGLVHCGATCDVEVFTVPASKPLRLEGTPGPGDTSVLFDTDCNDDGTVPLGDAVFQDCTLSCDCTSIP